MRYILLFFLSLTTMWLSAQAPGYLGKQNFIKADASFVLILRQWFDYAGASRYSEFFDNNRIFEGRAGLQAGHVISRNQAFTMGLSFLKTKMESDAYTPAVNFPIENDRFDYHQLGYKLKGKTVAFGYSKYRTKKGGLAPLGAFQTFHLQATFVSPEITDQVVEYGYSNYPKEHGEVALYKTVFWTFGWEFGQNFIIKDQLLINYGLQINIPLDFTRLVHGMDDYSVETGSLDRAEAYNEEAFKQRAFNRMFQHDLFHLKFGLGYLF